MTQNAINVTNPIGVDSGGSGDSTLVAYAPLCGGTTTTSPIQSVASVGTTGQVLTSNGASALPSFQSLSSGAPILIQTQTASSSASLVFNTGITYSGTYFFVFDNVMPSGTNVQPELLVSNTGGAPWATSGYKGGVNYVNYNSSTWTNINSTAYIPICYTASTTGHISGVVHLSNVNLSTYMVVSGETVALGGYSILALPTGITGITGVNAFEFLFSSGTITSGTISLYYLPS